LRIIFIKNRTIYIWEEILHMRTSGVLMPISSLPSPYGIGTFGKEAKNFVDFLEKAGQTYWQILPLCPTGYGDSPYQSFSSFAGNPYFIDLKLLIEDGYLKKKECDSYPFGTHPNYVDYENMYYSRYALLRIAYVRFAKNIPEDFQEFLEMEELWLDDYALFMAIKNANDGKSWLEWPEPLKKRNKKALDKAKEDLEYEIGFYYMLQYLFYKQWGELKDYANEKGIRIIGDVPIYVALDSADVWANPKQFYLDKDLNPIEVAGCPPDAFSDDGQLWGNPLFRWNVMKKDGYSWWTNRIQAMAYLYDVVRIDHFRGFESYYAIPFGDINAKRGSWKKGPGISLFEAITENLGEIPIICENLGLLTEEVQDLLDETGYPGMKVLQFAFGSGTDCFYLPHTYDTNCVVYTGTHDNDTTIGWMKNADKYQVDYAKRYFALTKEEGYNWGMIRGAMSSVADTCIIPMQDIIGLGSEARINAPSSLGNNWKWRASKTDINAKLANKLYSYTEAYDRLRK